MRALLSVALLLAVAMPAQQQCASRNDDGLLVTNVTMGGPNLLLGMKLVAQSTYTITAVQVATGLREGPGSMAIWSHDPIGDKPATNLSGDGAYQQCAVIAWQGAVLPTPVTVTIGQEFWVVWGMPNSSRAAQSTNPIGDVPYRGSFDGGLNWNGQNNGQNPWPARPWKIRLFCPYPTNPPMTVGTGKAGGGAFVPQTVVSGWGAQGNRLDVILKDAAPGVACVLGIGTPTTFPLPPIGTVYVLPLVVVPSMTSGVQGRSAPGSGQAGSFEIAIPRGSAGFPLTLQWFVLDPQAAAGISHTAGTTVLVL